MSFAPEEQLIVLCSRTNMDSRVTSAVADVLRQDLDWDYIIEVSIRHGVSPLFYYGLTHLPPSIELTKYVPARVMDELRTIYHNAQARNRRLYGVVHDMAESFSRVGVPAMGLKDVQLAMEVYPDIGLRPMGDIDILIHKDDYKKVARCMAGLGFKPLPGPDIPFTLKYAEAHHFHRPHDNVWVDMQWNACDREWDVYGEGNVAYKIATMWAGALPMNVGDAQIFVPKPEDMLFHLCLHLEGHSYSELILFCDIVELLHRYGDQFDWQYLIEIAKKYRTESSIYYVLLLVQRLFWVSLPDSILRALQPAYFKANIFGPLFGNLTTLHLSLDGIRLAAAPPRRLLREFDVAVRGQALAAMQTYRAIDDIASRFTGSGGDLVILDGTSSEKIYPDPSLDPFGDLQLFILESDLPRMRATLSDYGFHTQDQRDPDLYAKEWQAESRDPVFQGQPTRMGLQARVRRGLDSAAFAGSAGRPSKKSVAVKSIKAKLVAGSQPAGSAGFHATLDIVALSPEDLLLYLGAQLGGQKQNRLFGLCGLLEFFRGYTGTLDWRHLTDAARRYNIGEQVCQGLLMVNLVSEGQGPVPAEALDELACRGVQPRILEWARYDPNSVARYTNFRTTFYYLFSLLSVRGAGAKMTYLLRSAFGSRQRGPVLPGVISELLTGAVASFKKQKRTTRDFAYWMEP